MSLERANHVRALERFPRVSGDEPGAGLLRLAIVQFSPRERG